VVTRKIRLNDWVLRDEILVASHRWPLIVTFILAGSLLGWAAAMLWPVPYQASAEMSVSLDPYRFADDSYVPEFANTEFRNPDDYKHWQMSQLSVLAFSDEYLEETLNRLKEGDPAWENEDLSGLRAKLAVHWRNAGRWRLSARVEDPQAATQLVETWRQVILEKTNQAVARAREIYLFDIEQQAIQAGLLQTRQELDDLKGAQSELSNWREAIAASPQGEILNPEKRAQLSALAAHVAGLDSAWQVLLGELPAESSASQEYLPWSEQLLEVTGQMVAEKEESLQGLHLEQLRVEEERLVMLQEGKGLSFTLSVAVLQDAPPEISQPRPASSVALVGGLVGFLAWGMLFVARISTGRQT
jgi:hypothetical protein